MPKFYRYLIYSMTKHYSKNSDSLFNAILMLSLVHCIQLLTLLFTISFFTEFSIPSIFGSKTVFYPITAIFVILNFLVFYDKKKVKMYFDEFENMDVNYKKRFNLFVILYTLGSVLYFFIQLIILDAIRN